MGSPRKRRSKEEDDEEDGPPEEEAVQEEEPNNNSEEEEAPEASSSGKKQKKEERNRRKKQRESLRSKNLGLIQIDKDQQQSTKIVFGDDDEDGERSEDDKEDDLSPVIAEKEEDEDDDDDAVEQMDSKAARDMVLAQLERERETKALTATKKKKKRKARKEEEDSDDDDDMPEEDFFAELEAQKKDLKKSRRAKPETVIPKHTIFQTSNNTEGSAAPTPIEVNPGMELVVLGDEEEDNLNAPLSLMCTEPSQSSLFHSRVIVDGSDIISAKQRQKQKRSGMKPPEPNWKRSQKMNRLLLTKGKGKAAANFVVKAKTYQF